ncbi:glycosyltransferase family 4 protein [Candidatus Peregrinibacteria bacterium]|nr:glycosyltransferase family 4 protein [Candidatus Peregrinibacteria bacterium]
MKHILIIDPADFLGGAELFTLDFLAKADHTQFSFTLATGKNDAYLQKAKKRKARVVSLSIPRLKSFTFSSLKHLYKSVQALRLLIDTENIDLLQTNSIRAHIVGSLAVIRKKKPIIWMLHDCTFPRFFLKLLIRIPMKIVVGTEFVRGFYKKMLPRRFHEKFIVIPNGVDIDFFQNIPVTRSLHKELNLGEGVRFVGMVGRIDWWKGQDHFIRAAGKVTAKLPKTRFLIIGNSSAHDLKTVEFEKKIRELVHDLNLEREVFFLGFRTEVPPLIRQLSVLVHASTEPEPFGRVIREAMATGIPVIASPFGGPTEIIEDGRNGFLVDPNDHELLARSICRILEHSELAEKFRENGIRTVQKYFDLAKVARRIEKLYEER